MPDTRLPGLVAFALALALPRPILAADPSSPWAKWDGSPKSVEQGRYRPIVGTKGMVSSDDEEASKWGAEILRQGGNAIDAAVATAFALAVSRPQYASLGGGGFLVYCPKPGPTGPKPCQAIDYREKAPAKASRDMYLRDGKADTELSQDGALASGVPGVTAGLLLALEKLGTLPRQKVLSWPIREARAGFQVSGNTEGAAASRWEAMNGEARRIFGCVAGGKRAPCAAGKKILQPDLAKVLEEISRRGKDGFYRGWVASRIAKGLQAAGGIITEKDLAAYEAKVRAPVTRKFSQFEIVSMPPPSAGGALVAQLFAYADLAEKDGLLSDGFGAARTLHALAHAMGLAFADRASLFGDPDFVDVPVAKLLSEDYVENRWKSTFRPDHAAIPKEAGALKREGENTTHFSVIDRDGNAVAVTTTINDNFGSGFVPPGTGVVMNDQMDDFSAQPGVPNMYGLVGAEANAIAPGKRPLSSMSPTIVRDEQGNARISIGAQGGPRITTSVFLSLLYRLKFGMSLPDAVLAPRLHEQWKPEALMVESQGFSPDSLAKLKTMGYEPKEIGNSGRQHAIERFPNGRTWGVSDPRAEGAAVAE